MELRSLRKRLAALARLGDRAAPPREAPAASGRPVRLEEALAGREVRASTGGAAWLLETTLPAPGGDPGPRPEELLFVDIEATGLTCSPLFLIGEMTRKGRALRVRQLLARDYAEEAAVISLFLDGAAGAGRLVSFNGKSYDLPYIRMRAAATGVPFDLDLPHTDLLHECRRAFGDRLPDCRLQTLERWILGRRRTGDIPGREIPDAYHAFVRTGDAAEMVRIVDHNRRDLVTLAELLARL